MDQQVAAAVFWCQIDRCLPAYPAQRLGCDGALGGVLGVAAQAPPGRAVDRLWRGAGRGR